MCDQERVEMAPLFDFSDGSFFSVEIFWGCSDLLFQYSIACRIGWITKLLMWIGYGMILCMDMDISGGGGPLAVTVGSESINDRELTPRLLGVQDEWKILSDMVSEVREG